MVFCLGHVNIVALKGIGVMQFLLSSVVFFLLLLLVLNGRVAFTVHIMLSLRGNEEIQKM